MNESPRLLAGAACPTVTTQTLAGAAVVLPGDAVGVTHLQFRRFAGCPVCNLHLRSVARRIEELRAADVRVVAFFHSTADSMRPYQGDLPFDVVADPDKEAYRAFGVEASLASVLHPAAWGSLMRGMMASHPSSAFDGEGGHLGLPADFLILDGRIAAAHYGAHAADHWSVDEVLARVARLRGGASNA